MAPFPTVVALGDARVHVSCSYGGDMSTKVEGMVNKEFSLRTILGVPNVEPDNGYIRLGGGSDDSRFGCQGDVFKEFDVFHQVSNIVARDLIFIRTQIWDASDFQIKF